MRRVKNIIKTIYNKTRKNIFDALSKKAIAGMVKEDNRYYSIWKLSFEALPNLVDHFVNSKLDTEAVARVRMLICAETYFLKEVITILNSNGLCINNYLDIGDSDGAVRILLRRSMENFKIETLGINLQTEAVWRIREKGLAAECIDAMHIHRNGKSYDIVSVFETLEHLTDPISFLINLREMVGLRLIVSVPLITKSRVNLAYLGNKWPKEKVPTIENTHIFELSPKDWQKIFLHSGWSIEAEKNIRQFPSRGLLKWLMQYLWRNISFEGFWFVSLKKDNTYTQRFQIQ